jgi:hypothetical protein
MPNKIISLVLTFSFIFAPVISFPVANAQSATATTSQGLTTCQFVEFLINIGVIAPEKVNAARSVFNCSNGNPANNAEDLFSPSSSSRSSQSQSSTFSVDLKINNKNRADNILAGERATLSWKSKGAENCYLGEERKGKSGSKTLYPEVTGVYIIRCENDDGRSVYDSAAVNIVTTNTSSNQPSIELYVNGAWENVDLTAGSVATVSWNSQNTTSCLAGTTVYPTSGSFQFNVPNISAGSSLLDVAMSCFGPNGTTTDLILARIINNGGGQSTGQQNSEGALVGQIAQLRDSSVAVYFYGEVSRKDKCWGEDKFYKVFISPKEGGAVKSVNGLSPAPYRVGDSSVLAKALWWDQGGMSVPAPGALALGSADGVQSYNCSTDGGPDNIVDIGVIYNVGQYSGPVSGSDSVGYTYTDGQLSSTADSMNGSTVGVGSAGAATSSLASVDTYGEVPMEDAQAAARQIKKEDDDGFLGTGLDMATVMAVAAFAACATGVGCLVSSAIWYNSTVVVSASLLSGGAAYGGTKVIESF